MVGGPTADTLPTKWSHVNRRSGKIRQPMIDVLTIEPRRQRLDSSDIFVSALSTVGLAVFFLTVRSLNKNYDKSTDNDDYALYAAKIFSETTRQLVS